MKTDATNLSKAAASLAEHPCQSVAKMQHIRFYTDSISIAPLSDREDRVRWNHNDVRLTGVRVEMTTITLKKNHANVTKKQLPAAKPEEIPSKHANIVLRIPTDMLQKVDQAVINRVPKIPRNLWLLEAVVLKLNSEEK